jgi:hypothetical protein
MKKIGELLPCRTAPTQPIQPRATTNSLCRTNKRSNNFISLKTIRIGNIVVPIPCFLLPHEAEYIALANQIGYINAVKILAFKYNVNIEPTIQNVTRYKYPNVVIKTMPPVIQFNISFRTDGPAPSQTIVQPNPKWSVMQSDAKYVSVCNNDTKTFSSTFTEMKKNATFWVNHLPDFDASTLYYVLINPSTNSTLNLNIQSGYLILQNDDRIVFLPVILNILFLFYKPYLVNMPINLLDIVSSQDVLEKKIIDVYEEVKSSCIIRQKYARLQSNE